MLGTPNRPTRPPTDEEKMSLFAIRDTLRAGAAKAAADGLKIDEYERLLRLVRDRIDGVISPEEFWSSVGTQA